MPTQFDKEKAVRKISGPPMNCRIQELENVLGLQLDQSRLWLAACLNEWLGNDSLSVRQRQVLMVVNVEYLGFDIQHGTLSDWRQLVDGCIQFIETRTGHIVPWDVVPEVVIQSVGTLDIRLTGIRFAQVLASDTCVEPLFTCSLAFGQDTSLARRENDR